MEIRLLGPVEVLVAGRRLDIGPPQRRAVLAALAVDVGRPVSVQTVIDRVWGEAAPAQVRSAVHGNITWIRRILAEVNTTGNGGRPWTLVRRSGGYLLQLDADRVDLHRFRGLAAAARDEHYPEVKRTELLREALALWHGAPLTDLSGEWAQRMRESWGRQRLDAAVHWARTELRLGNHEQVIAPVRALLAEYPLAEPLVAVLMRAMQATGRAAEALDCYAAMRARLADGLGADPSSELQNLHQAILRGNPRPHAGRGTPPRGPSAAPPARAPATLPLDVHGFTGRTAELDALDAVAATAGGQSAAMVVAAVWGTAGVGKTALAVHWAHQVRDRFPDGQLYVNLRGFDPTGAAVTPTEAIRRFLDALDVPPQRIPADLDGQVALYRTLLANRRMLVLLDNARDQHQVRPLLPGAPGCLVLITSRNRLTSLVAAEGAHPLALGLLTPDEAADLLARRVGAARTAAEPDAVDEIRASCARLPLALAIVAARAIIQPRLRLADLAASLRDADGRLDTLTTGDPTTDVRAVFSWSYRQLSAAAARLFRLLGLHPGPDSSAAAAASLAGLPPPEVRPLLAELAGAHLIAEPAPGRYSFHDLLRAYAVEQAERLEADEQRRSAERRILDHYLHTAYTADLRLDPAGDSITLPAAGSGVTPEHPADHESALAWFAAEHRVLLAAIDRAASSGLDTHTWQLAWTLDDFLLRRGHWHDQVATLHTALAAGRRLNDPSVRARAHRLLARAYTQQGRYDDAHIHLGHALDLYGEAGEQSGQGHTHIGIAMLHERRGRHEDALHHAEQALTLYRASGHRRGQANALNMVGWCHARIGDHERALTCCEQALALFQELGDRQGQAATWDSLGYARNHLGHYEQATTCYGHALELYRELGNRYWETSTLTHLGDAHRAAGDGAAARAAWQAALRTLNHLEHPDADVVRGKLAALAALDGRAGPAGPAGP